MEIETKIVVTVKNLAETEDATDLIYAVLQSQGIEARIEQIVGLVN